MKDAAVVDDRRGLGGALRGLVGLRSTWPIGVVLVAAGALGWLAGARFTATGAPVGLNLIMAGLFGVDLGLPVPTGWYHFGAAVVAGLFFSRVEVQHRPFRWVKGADGARGRWVVDGLGHWGAWLIIITIDVATTFVGVADLVRTPAGVWPVFLEIAASREYNGAASLVLTFLPEVAIIAGWALAVKRRA